MITLRANMAPDTLDLQAKQTCDAVARSLTNKGRRVDRLGEHAIMVSLPWGVAETNWRIVVLRSGQIHIEAKDSFSAERPIPNLEEHIADAFLSKAEFTIRQVDGRVEMMPRPMEALPAPRTS